MKMMFLLIVLGLLIFAEVTSCNAKGSLAAELNWANHGICGE